MVVASLPEWTPSDLTALGSVLIGFLGAAVGLGSLWLSWKRHEQTLLLTQQQIESSKRIADNQIRATVLAANRQTWINSLRDLLARTIAQYQHIGRENIRVLAQIRENRMTDDEAGEARGAMRDVLVEAERLEAHVALMLNPAEEDHREIRDTLSVLAKMVRLENVEAAKHEMEPACEALIATCQKVLKREWEVTKALQ